MSSGPPEVSPVAAVPARAPYDLRRLPGRRANGEPLRLLDLQPELLESVASKLQLPDLSAVATTCHAATPLQAVVIATRIALLRELTHTSHAHLRALIIRLPRCTARTEIAAVIESSMQTFHSVCTCNEDFLRLSRAVALRGLSAPFTSPIQAARLARSCCRTCDDVTRALAAVKTWLTELTELVASAGRLGERALIEAGLGIPTDLPQPLAAAVGDAGAVAEGAAAGAGGDGECEASSADASAVEEESGDAASDASDHT